MLRPTAPRAGWARTVACLLVALVVAATLQGCTDAGSQAAPARTGNARVSATEDQAGAPSGGARAAPATAEGTLSSTELGLVYQYILQGYIEPVDHTTLVEAAISAVRETGLTAHLLPIDLAPVELAATDTGSPEGDWAAFARGYDAIVGKHPAWAAEARPDRAVLRRMLASLKDDHSLYIAPDEVRRMNETGFTGVGVRITRARPEDLPYVVEVFRDSPAAGAGIKAGDQIAAVDGASTNGRTLTEIVNQIRGQQGTRVVLSIVRGGQPPIDVRVTRGAVDAPRVEGAVRGGVLGILRIRSFGDQVPEQVQQLLTQGRNRGARAWIVDLRGNPGGSIEAVARVAANFIENRPVGLAVDRDGDQEPIVAPGRPGQARFPFVVLVDHETSSGAEVLAAAIKEYQVAPLVGTKTAGSTAIAIPQQLSDGSAVQLTVRRLVSPSGAAIDGQGVQPDVEVDLTVDDLQRGEDPQFLRAVELLVGGPSVSSR